MPFKKQLIIAIIPLLSASMAIGEPLIVRDLNKPVIVDEPTTIDAQKDCEKQIATYEINPIKETKKFYIDEPVAFYSSLKEVKIKGSKLTISLEQRKEILEYESPMQMRTPVFLEYDSNIFPNDCREFARTQKEINVQVRRATGKSGWAKNYHPEKILIIGFEELITIGMQDKGWGADGILELDLENKIRTSKKASAIFELTIKCVSCKNTKEEADYPAGLSAPIVMKKELADFRFIKTQLTEN